MGYNSLEQMKREDIRTFLKAGTDAIAVYFDSGRLTEFNKLSDKGFPFAWLESLEVDTDFGGSGGMLIDNWRVSIHIAKLDKFDSRQDKYESIVDACDHIARKLIWQYNLILQSASQITTANQDLYKLVTMSDIRREPFIKKHADVLTGVILSFNITSPDKTDVCP